MNTASGDGGIPEKNPLLISAIITRILELLPFRDIKNGRLICLEWNSHAEALLRKKAKILLTPKFGTSDYFEYYSDCRLSTLPFTAFKLTNNFYSTKGFLMSDLDDFFKQCGKNIKSLELDCINICQDDRNRIKTQNINSWMEKLSDNMDKLTICVNRSSTRLAFNLENLAGVKSLTLSGCDVIVNSSDINRITPLEISLTDVTFLNQSKTTLTNVVVNDFVDFSNCSNIKLIKQGSNTVINFDMSKDIVNAKKVEYFNIQVLNSGFSKIKTDFLAVNTTPSPEQSEVIKMQTKELDIQECSAINLTYLPQTIEKLKIAKTGLLPEVTGPLDLPNLKYLHFDQSTITGIFSLENAKRILSWFKNCSNLVELHFESGDRKCEFDVAWIPKSVKRLKLTQINNMVFVGKSLPVDVDVLLLDSSIVSAKVEMVLEKIKPKMLVKLVGFDMDSGWGGKEKAEDFISFVKKNTQLEKIVINTLYGLGKKSSPGKESFLQFVGEESPCYEFNNQIAKGMSKEDFKKYYDINYISAQ